VRRHQRIQECKRTFKRNEKIHYNFGDMFHNSIIWTKAQSKTEKSQIVSLLIKSFDEICPEINLKKINKYYTKDFCLWKMEYVE
jgi:uncharacterized membrane-anchored protein YjiN (DUF445 family)